MKTIDLSLALAQRLALNAQLLDGRTDLSAGKEGVAQTIETLGYVQIDTIAVIERAHHHTLWTRQPDYEAEMLHELQAEDRRIFEYWGHAASYLPISDYRYYRPRMQSFNNPDSKWAKRRLEQCGHLMQPILARIREEGPLSSKDFAAPEGSKRQGWWDWKPAKIALELLFWRGELMISERRNFQRVYDLTERVLPDDVDTRMPDQAELGQFYVRRALAAHGLAQEKEIRDHLHGANKAMISQAIQALVDAGEVISLTINEGDGKDYYALAGAMEQAADLKESSPHLFFLSPFDNLIIQRERIKRLFDFDYTIECYVPAAKRQYGYFTLPILWGEALVGRLDPKAERKEKRLIIRNLVFEPQFAAFEDFLPAFVAKLADFVRFNQCEHVVVEAVSPSKVKAPLTRLVREAGLGKN